MRFKLTKFKVVQKTPLLGVQKCCFLFLFLDYLSQTNVIPIKLIFIVLDCIIGITKNINL